MDLERHEPSTLASQAQGSPRLKSSLRMRYEIEAKYLRDQNGDLEQVRQRLGLSKRRICQLLLVDPSAWTRWTSGGRKAPPHIYRALDWYLSILEKDPEYRRLSTRFADWLNREKNHEGRLARLEAQVREKGLGGAITYLIIFFFGGLVMFLLLKRL